MTSIDPGQDVIKVAKEHLTTKVQLVQRIEYRNESIEFHSSKNQCKYDAVIVSEVLEHVNDKQIFLEKCLATLKVYCIKFFLSNLKFNCCKFLLIARWFNIYNNI